MQDPSTYSQINNNPQLIPEHEHLKCPRCDSNNTKFCYYNNYNLSQPRHFCKNCRRYWTKGGTLRNIPVGGGTRKATKRPKKSSSSTSTSPSSATTATATATEPPSSANSESEQPPSKPEPSGGFRGGGSSSSSFSSLLSENGQFGNLSMSGVGPTRMDRSVGLTEDPNSDESGLLILNLERPQPEFRSDNINSNMENHELGGDSSSCWNGGDGWSGLSMYTPPGSTFQ